jgi:thiosulfate/3-mercaptopyruvate sulfurtransferase
MVMKYKKGLFFCLVLVLVITLGACAKKGPASNENAPGKQAVNQDSQKSLDSAKATVFVDTAWLKENLSKVIVIDARKDTDYGKGHIPGAVNAVWQTFANVKGKPGDAKWGVLLAKDQLAEAIGKLGIDGQKPVIICNETPGWGEDGRVLWTLKVAGIKDAKILDGGLEAWKNANGEISKDAVQPTAVKYEITALDDSINATSEWINANMKNIKIVDSRAPKEYGGATDFGEARGGHLPGAINISFEDMFNKDGTTKSTEELKGIFTKAGLSQNDEIITYCTKGIRSGYMALMMKMAGYEKARNYDASYYEWAGNKNLPLEK